MSLSRMNVLVYTGPGSTVESVKHALHTLRRLLPHNAITPVSAAALTNEPWTATCALLVFPGGADLGFCSSLDGPANRRIAEYVRRGGRYLGFCAGGYYGSARCEFEVGNGALEVVGARELGFFPGTCRGGAFAGFGYHSEAGARAAKVGVERGAFGEGEDFGDGEVAIYYNGGGVFVGAEEMRDKGVEVLASYRDDLDVECGGGRAAVVYCKVGDGAAILTGPHPEFEPVNLPPQPSIPGYAALLEDLVAHSASRVVFLRACLLKMGLEPASSPAAVPSLSNLHLSALEPSNVPEMLADWEDIISREGEGQAAEEYVRAENDVFHIEKRDSRWAEHQPANVGTGGEAGDGMVDYTAVVKRMVPHEEEWPDVRETPSFNHGAFYTALRDYRRLERRGAETWGDMLLYGEVMTSTNTILEKNPKLLAKLPTGFTVAATTQVAGRGRGSNVWLAPAGCLIMSTVINHPAHLAASRPIVFIQYLAAIATAEAVQSYGPGYENVPIRLKWPNDIYASDPNNPTSYVKIGGILANCSYSSGNYQIVLGIGVNTSNPHPTTSLSSLVPPSTPAPIIERLIARMTTRLEVLYGEFARDGFTADMERRYYNHWLHTRQLVTLEAEGGVRARVMGITRDWGMLKAEEVGFDGRGTGRVWALQSDENSFDYWKGLVKRKT
ncbi:related to BPL1 - biotin holocarboxylase synthetase [Cephalotrichum gorgonifer]|uniref:Related to BPL1 - biotin holocarboxylase synthetase n=1 Tax=Cephalotrichum gorgonifer TaxID=2041049 RepID=A0AAE8N7C9_9PEZI|nr:related to BPL1 - biotin holocarboxylase synthetase [Cephalotrichum gorgonifer]